MSANDCTLKSKYSLWNLVRRFATAAFVALLGCGTPLNARYGSDRVVETDTLTIAFPINRSDIDTTFSCNSESINRLKKLISTARHDSLISIDSIRITGIASPDGKLESNRRLANLRAESLSRYLSGHLKFPKEKIVETGNKVAWSDLRNLVSLSEYAWKQDALDILAKGNDESPSDTRLRMERLKKLRGGSPWKVIKRDFLPKLRISNAESFLVTLKTIRKETPIVSESEEIVNMTVADSVAIPSERIDVLIPVIADQSCVKNWFLRSSVPAWATAVANISGEYGFSCRWSASLSLAYSAWNFGSSDCKFRTFRFQPELRYWFANGYNGWFADIHAAMIAYNVALPSWAFRIQDRNGRHPALGGGIGAGFRFNLDKKGRWRAEASVGAGIYYLDYDRFVNKGCGSLVDSRKRVFAGIDNISFSIIFNFNKQTK